MSVRKVFKAHQKEVTSLCWHPENDALLASGGYDSQLHFWDTYGSAEPLKSVLAAHEGPIWSLAWHPLGHLLVSGSHDYSTRFWSRARPGDQDFDELLPKKVAAPGDIPAGSVPPPPVIPMTVMDSGIFAGPPPKEAPLIHKLGSPKDVNGAGVEQAKLGLTMGEGEHQKGILDVSDFDAEDQTTKPSLAITDAAEGKTASAAETSKEPEKAAPSTTTETKASEKPETPANKTNEPQKATETKAFTKAAPQPAPVSKAAETSASTVTESAKVQPDEEKSKKEVEAKTVEKEETTKADEKEAKPKEAEPKAEEKSLSKASTPAVSSSANEETDSLKREAPPASEASDSSKKPKIDGTSGSEAPKS